MPNEKKTKRSEIQSCGMLRHGNKRTGELIGDAMGEIHYSTGDAGGSQSNNVCCCCVAIK